MHCQCHFGKVKSSQCSSVDTGAAVTLPYVTLYTGQEVMAIICDWAIIQMCLLQHDFIYGNLRSQNASKYFSWV